jgi:hypothetical protein
MRLSLDLATIFVELGDSAITPDDLVEDGQPRTQGGGQRDHLPNLHSEHCSVFFTRQTSTWTFTLLEHLQQSSVCFKLTMHHEF